MTHPIFTNKNITNIKTQAQLLALLKKKGFDDKNLQARIAYTIELEQLQLELLKLQNWILKNKKRIVIIFEGRDAAGKGGAIRRFIKYLNPRFMRVVALGKPTDVEKGHWYFRRYVKELPHEGEIVFFDRSWYNRAVVEPVMGFCKSTDYRQFIQHVSEFEHMLYEDGVTFIKFWFAITKDEQLRRFNGRETNPLKQWKLSPVDIKSRDEWDEYTRYIREMFVRTHTNFSPWVLVRTDNKRAARLESIRYVLSLFDYEGKDNAQAIHYPDPNIVQRFYRSMFND